MFMHTNVYTVRQSSPPPIVPIICKISLFSIINKSVSYIMMLVDIGGVRWLRGQRAWRVLVEAKQRSQWSWSVMGRVAKIYYLELLRASEGTLSS
jgi:hypothetical protein